MVQKILDYNIRKKKVHFLEWLRQEFQGGAGKRLQLRLRKYPGCTTVSISIPAPKTPWYDLESWDPEDSRQVPTSQELYGVLPKHAQHFCRGRHFVCAATRRVVYRVRK